ncbi:FAD-dependent monooxygenase, partial [Staphylococcus epidermidis]|uniref:FAD-dependent monooxygenase n=1 Tax=Staphylococcus epidermidis TaxID=1282 RepID=UPI0030C0B3B8
PIHIKNINWYSSYRSHHRVAEHFRVNRAFICGDAGHIHSPAGGQGMNTGISDAFNLAWKLSNVIQGKADKSILDTYEPERIEFAKKLVTTNDT